MLRRLERWLHQHIFKVGWLLTKRSQTTTILYYTFFLPGVVLHEIIVWLVAGILNVHAERAIAWPEATAIAELKLNFIRLAKNTGRVKIAIISLSPLLGGLAVLWLISSSVLNLNIVIAVGRGGSWDDLVGAARLLLATPDVWLWVYLMFTIASTMFPNRESLRGWRPALLFIGVAIVALFVLGLAQPLLLDNLALPITDGLSRLALIFVVIIAIDLLVTGVLGTLEAIIERITGHSATFQNGKLVALTKEDILRLREQQRAKKERERQKQTTKAPRLPSGPPSFYKLPLPIPGAPGKEAVEPSRVSPASNLAFPSPATSSPLAGQIPTGREAPAGRAGPSVITGTAVVKTDDELKPDAPLQEAKIDLPAAFVKPAPRPAPNPAFTPASYDDDEEDVDDEDQEEDEQPSSDVIDDMLAAIGGDQDDEDEEDDEADRL